MPLRVKEEGRAAVLSWVEKLRKEKPRGEIAVTTSHIPASLDLTSVFMIRKLLGWENPVKVIMLDTVPPKVDLRAGFHGVHGYRKGELHLHPPRSFWEKTRPYYALPPNERTIGQHHIHEDLRPHGDDIVDFHEALRRWLYGELRIGEGVEFVRASQLVRELFFEALERYGPDVLRSLTGDLLRERYVVGGSVVRGNVRRLVAGISSSLDKKAQKKLFSFVQTGDKNSLTWLKEKVSAGEIYPKGELFLALLLLNGLNHWGNNYLENEFRINDIVARYGGSGRQLTWRFEDGYSPVVLYLPGGEKTSAISSVVNVLLHHGEDPVSHIHNLIKEGKKVSLIVPPRI